MVFAVATKTVPRNNKIRVKILKAPFGSHFKSYFLLGSFSLALSRECGNGMMVNSYDGSFSHSLRIAPVSFLGSSWISNHKLGINWDILFLLPCLGIQLGIPGTSMSSASGTEPLSSSSRNPFDAIQAGAKKSNRAC